MKKYWLFRLIFGISFFIIMIILSSCQEVDVDLVEQESKIEKRIDLEKVYTPSEVIIYSTAFWKEENKKIIDAFLDGTYDKEEAQAVCEHYISNSDSKHQKILNIYDSGEKYYGYKKHDMEAGVTFLYENMFPNSLFDIESKEYFNRGEIFKPEFNEEEKNIFAIAEEKGKEYLEKLNMKYYISDASLVARNKTSLKEYCTIFWRQKIDDIPISSRMLNKDYQTEATIVYNSKLPYNDNMVQYDSVLKTEFVNGDMVSFSNTNAITDKKAMKKCSIVPILKAYEKVESQYEHYVSEYGMPVLETAKLEYKLLKIEETLYLYPIWTFCIRTKQNSDELSTIWTYYLIDAISGDYFTGIDIIKEK